MDVAQRREILAAALSGLEAGGWTCTEAHCKALLFENPADLEATLLLGFAYAGMGQAVRAAPVLDRVARRRRSHVHPCKDFATLGRVVPVAHAIALYRACLHLDPANKSLRHDFASFLLDHDRAAEAEVLLRGALDSAAGQHLMGLALAEQGQFAAAIPHFRTAAEISPKPAMAWTNLGMVLKIEGQFDAALAAYDEAIARASDDATIRVNRIVALLQAGRWTEAWREGDWRLRLPGYRGLPEATLLPNIDTLGDLRGRTILATHEEGFGDTLQFMRYLPLLAARGARVVAQMPAALTRVVRTLPGIAAVISENAAAPRYDFHCPMVSLPRAFGTTPDSIPGDPYLKANPASVAYWATRLPRTGLRVGLAWAGQARPWLPGFAGLDARRSAGLAALAPLGRISGIRFVALQMGAAAAQPPSGMRLMNPMEDVRDFADTAAIVANLDLVISVDTSIVHLAGALGKKVFMLDRYDNCWRWLTGRTDTPWYRNMTIFRQDVPGDWSAPMRRLAAAVVDFRDAIAAGARPSLARELADAA